jgi:hypothetical protein
MERLRESIRALIKEISDMATIFLVNMPPRGWTSVMLAENGHMEFSAGTCVDWQFLAYLILRQIHKLESYSPVLEAFRDEETINSKILWDSDEPDRYLLDAGPRATWIWDKINEPYLITCYAKHKSAIFDAEVFEATFAQLISYIEESPFLSVTQLSPLVNFDMAEEAIDLSPGVRVRRLNAQEVENWVNGANSQQIIAMPVYQLRLLHCAIEITHRLSKGEYGYDDEQQKLKGAELYLEEQRIRSDVLGVLRLLTNRHIEAAFTQSESWGVFCHQLSIDIPQSPQPRLLQLPIPKLTNVQREQITVLWDGVRTGINSRLLRLAFRRWSAALTRLEEEDRLVDYWIGFESLFCPDSTQEVKFRSSIRIAAFLGKIPQRELIYSEMRHSYDWRSAIVHGSGDSKQVEKLKKKESLYETSAKTRGYLRDVLLRIATSERLFDPTKTDLQLLRGEYESCPHSEA